MPSPKTPERVLLTLAIAAFGCTDDSQSSTTHDTATSSSCSTSSSTTTATATATATATTTTTTTTTTGPTGTIGSSTTGTTAESTSTASTTSAGTSTTGAVEPFEIPFVSLDPFLAPPPALVTPGWLLITDAAEWTAHTGIAVPPEIDLENKWLLLGSLGAEAFPGHALEVSTLVWDAATISVQADAIAPGPDCETYTFTWPTAALLSIDPLEVEVNAVAQQYSDQETSCAGGAGDSESCNLDTPCATDLLCAGLIRTTVLLGQPGGMCLPKANAGLFTGNGAALPDGGPSVEIDLQVAGLTSVDMDVVIWVELDHPAPEDLVIELRNPSDNQVPVWNKKPSPLHPGGLGIVPTGFSGDESVNGTWTLVATDTAKNGQEGSITGWKIEIMSRLD